MRDVYMVNIIRKSQNPFFPDVQPSQEQNPDGYKGVIKLGYAFHVNKVYDITPYLRLEAGKDMSLVYADTNGNYIHSTNYAILPGFKQTFKLGDNFAPYIDIYGGLNQVQINGDLYDNGGKGAWTNNVSQSATVSQYQITYELGAAFKVTEHQSVIPYIQFQYNTNDADAVAAAPRNQNGFGISTLTTNQQVYALKYSYAW